PGRHLRLRQDLLLRPVRVHRTNLSGLAQGADGVGRVTRPVPEQEPRAPPGQFRRGPRVPEPAGDYTAGARGGPAASPRGEAGAARSEAADRGRARSPLGRVEGADAEADPRLRLGGRLGHGRRYAGPEAL